MGVRSRRLYLHLFCPPPSSPRHHIFLLGCPGKKGGRERKTFSGLSKINSSSFCCARTPRKSMNFFEYRKTNKTKDKPEKKMFFFRCCLAWRISQPTVALISKHAKNFPPPSPPPFFWQLLNLFSPPSAFLSSITSPIRKHQLSHKRKLRKSFVFLRCSCCMFARNARERFEI